MPSFTFCFKRREISEGTFFFPTEKPGFFTVPQATTSGVDIHECYDKVVPLIPDGWEVWTYHEEARITEEE